MDIKLSVKPELKLVKPDPERDASAAFRWFSSKQGRDTLMSTGVAPEAIPISSLELEKKKIASFIQLEECGERITWMMQYDNETIGATWIDLVRQNEVDPPSVHMMIGDPDYRNRGIGQAVLSTLINYCKSENYNEVYSRHLVSNTAVVALSRKLGFTEDGLPYRDNDSLLWQNIKLTL